MSFSRDLMKFNSNTSARDKLLRVVQYGSRLVVWHMTHGSADVQSEAITKLKKLEAALSMSRKLFRMGNSIDLAHKAIDALSIKQKIVMVLTVFSHSCKSAWLVLDHVLWLAKVGLVKIDLPYWTQYSLKAWLCALLSATAVDIIKFEKVQISIDKHKKENGVKTELPPQLKKDMYTARMAFWKDFADLFIPLSGLKYISPGFGAGCGVVSSVIGFVQEWEKHIRPLCIFK